MDEDGNPIETEKVDDILYDENGDVIEVNIGEDANPIVSDAPKSKTLPIPPGSNSLFCLKDDNGFRIFCHKIANHPYFGNFVLICILISSFLLAAEDPVRPRAKINEVNLCCAF